MQTATSADGTPIAFERWGSGPVVILIGGAFNDRGTWAELAGALADLGFSAISYDRRGRGDSGDSTPFAVNREIEDLHAVLAEAGSDGPAYAHGVSSGGALLLRAVAQGMPFARISVLEPPYRTAESPPAPPAYVGSLQQFIDADDRGGAVEYFMTAAVGLPAEVVAGSKTSPAWPALERMAHTLLYDAQILGGDDHSLPQDLLSQVAVPVLAVSSSASAPFLVAAAEAVARTVPNGRHEQLAGVFHQVPTETLAPALAGFYRS